MLIYMRHAERGDNEFPQLNSEIKHDPPITADSAATIAQAASEIAQVLQRSPIQHVHILSSKFLRCLMTAEQLVGHLQSKGLQVSQPLLISNEIGEYMREDWFAEYPLKSKLIVDSEHRPKYLSSKQWKELELEHDLPFPENYVMFHERISRFKRRTGFPEKGHCTIMVTHGFVVREMCWRMNQIPSIMGEVPYCGYAVFTHDGQTESLVKAKL